MSYPVLLPDWETVDCIGRGGFSTVYKIKKVDKVLGEVCSALKVIDVPQNPDEYRNMKLEGYDDQSIKTMFHSQVENITSECEIMFRFKGASNIVNFEDYKVLENENGYRVLIRMELLEPLLVFNEHSPLNEAEIVRLGMNICDALKLCAKFQIVHRDIKPQNIFVDKFDNYKLGDFGIARVMDHTTRATKIGTLTYIAPEVYGGKPYNNKTDIYSLGLVLYWFLNRMRLPFVPLPPAVPSPSDNENACLKRLGGDELPPPVNGCEELKRVVLKACAFNPDERYSSATEFYNALEEVKIALNKQTATYDKTVKNEGEKKNQAVDGIEATMPLGSIGGSASTPASDAKSTSVSGTKSTPASGTKSTPISGEKSTPVSGTKSTPVSGEKSSPASGEKSTPASGTKSTPASGTKSTPVSGGAKASGQSTNTSNKTNQTVDGIEPTMPLGNIGASSSDNNNQPAKDKTETPKKKSKKPLAVFIVIVLLIIASASAFVFMKKDNEEDSLEAPSIDADASTGEDDASAGEDLNEGDYIAKDFAWDFKDGVLTISGHGAMPDFMSGDDILWREYVDSIKTVKISDGITSIGMLAFVGCGNLEAVTIPNSITAIGGGAFEDTFIHENSDNWTDGALYIGDCLIDLDYKSGNFSNVFTLRDDTRVVSDYIFRDLEAIQTNNNPYFEAVDGVLFNKDKTKIIAYPGKKSGSSYEIPSTVTAVGGWALGGCENLTSITIPNSVTTMGTAAFAENRVLESISIPNSVKAIGTGAFAECVSLASVTIPDSVITIGDYAFTACALTSIIIPDSVITIGDYAFSGCDALTSVIIPDSVITIGDKSFNSCEALTSVVIPNSVTKIGDYAFSNCTSLTSVTIPETVTTIGDSAFSSCSSLEAINVNSNNSKFVSVEGILFNKDKTTLITYPAVKSNKDYTIPNSVTTIGDYAFYSCTSLTSITIPDSVTTIGYSAFSDCNSLTSVTIPNSVKTIGNGTFYSCTSLTSVTIPDSVTTIGGYAFYQCNSLTSVTIPNSVTIIGDGAFSDCESLASITIPDLVTTIGDFAFYSCASLTSITIPDSVTTIGEWAFSDCKSLETITYKGTTAEWEAISKGKDWNESTGDYTVKCTDGDIKKTN